MSKSIILFMWAYQPHFRIFMEIRAQNVIQSVAPSVQPRAILVGIRTPEKTEGHPVCVEPENEDWDPELFFNCATRAEQIYTKHPDHEIFYGDAPSMHDKPENIRKASVREAVEEVTSAYDVQHNTDTFCGRPTRVGGYHVVPILQFKKEQLLEYPCLPAPIKYQDYTAPTGLVDSIIECLLEEASIALVSKEPGRFFDTFSTDKTAILRKGAERFCAAITLATHDVMFQDVFNTINVISSIPYEKGEACGEILFSPEANEAVEIGVHFDKSIQLYDHRLARKVIEISGRDLSCVCHGSEGIGGLGILRTSDASGVFRVVFSGHFKWELYFEKILVMKSAYALPELPSVRLSEAIFRSTARRIFSGIDAEDEKHLWNIVDAAMEQRHGTMIVVSESAEEEARRLKKQSLGITPIELTADLVRRLSNIDGAILIDPKSACHAIGVILDGVATDEGDPSRGARYNSSIRYIASAKSATLCLVISEDGYVNMVPNLRPQIHKSEIESRIALL